MVQVLICVDADLNAVDCDEVCTGASRAHLLVSNHEYALHASHMPCQHPSNAPAKLSFSVAAQQPAQLGAPGNPLTRAHARRRAGLRADQLRAHDVLPSGAAAGRPGGAQPWRAARHARAAQRLSAHGDAPAASRKLLPSSTFLPPAVPCRAGAWPAQVSAAGAAGRTAAAVAATHHPFLGPASSSAAPALGAPAHVALASGVHQGWPHTCT